LDPISTLFSAYINMVTSNVQREITDVLGTEVQAVVINYEGIDIPFQYQIWRVQDKSVCDTYRQKVDEYSECTVKAKKMFGELCQKLSEKRESYWKYTKTKNMYCNAAISFQPTVASISASTENTPLEDLRQKCNLATASALGSTDRKLLADRDKACKAYQEAK
jgi:hypothetical protein